MPLPSTYVTHLWSYFGALRSAFFYALWTAADFMLFDNAVMIIFFCASYHGKYTIQFVFDTLNRIKITEKI
ncbi:Uncharacterised protein [Salmonella enterica subsp. salamae]|uniref:Uncharacterized protein n=1 Tax=Salmonella enterica subsp. salamae TaxID=59202 RepID=A0A6D2GEC3_SALER|nr:Uncharacterised protein [Salmonella enterica subsp. salamae]